MSVKVGLRFWTKIAACGLFLGSLLPVSVQAQTLSWKQQLGSSNSDYALDVTVNTTLGTDIYISGFTTGSLAGANQGGYDAWVAQYLNNGELVWKQQLGSSRDDISTGVATDISNNVYISGTTSGPLAGTNNAGQDAWIAKYDSRHQLKWKRQLGLFGPDVNSSGIATDGLGNIYISGYTTGSLAASNQGGFDAWVAKYSKGGNLLWTRQLGTSESDVSNAVATDSVGNVYISGYTTGSLGGAKKGTEDAWVAKYNPSGELVWKQQLGSFRSDISTGVATDSNRNVYISGGTYGTLAGAKNVDDSLNAWVAKYNSAGTLIWKRQLGGVDTQISSDSVATDSLGNVYISGGINSYSLPGRSPDTFVAKYSSSGTLLSKQQFGSSTNDSGGQVAVDEYNNIYIGGYTEGSVGGFNQGEVDSFLVQYRQ